MNNQLKYAGFLTVILGLAAGHAVAQDASPGARHVRADLNGFQEVNSISTTGQGQFTARSTTRIRSSPSSSATQGSKGRPRPRHTSTSLSAP